MSKPPLTPVPDGLTASASAWYRTVIAEHQLSTAGELATLEQAARALSRLEQCRALVDTLGIVVQGERGMVANPASRLELQHRAQFLTAVKLLDIAMPEKI